jgi:hypothetical protein
MGKSFTRQLLQLLPKSIRHEIYRRQLELPWMPDEDIQFKLVGTTDEFMGAIRVLHDSYVERRFMDRDPQGIRLTPYHLLPNTLTAVAVQKGRVVATMSIIRDNPLGLPMDKIFDLSTLRQNGEILCEVSALAIHPDYRGNGGKLLHSLIRFLWRYAYESFGIDRYVIAVNPSMAELYEAFYLFESLPVNNIVNQYDFVKGAPAVALSLPTMTSYDLIKKVYSKAPLERNLYQFMQLSHHKTEVYPHSEYYKVAHSIVSSEFIRDLRSIIPDLHARFSEETKRLLANQWGVDTFEEIGTETVQRQRFAVTSILSPPNSTQGKSSPIKVLDVSRSGLKLFIGKHQEMAETTRILKIPLGPSIISQIVAAPVWKNEAGTAGYKLVSADQEWHRMINHFENQNHLEQTLNRGTSKLLRVA